jgi:hypothetical protein
MKAPLRLLPTYLMAFLLLSCVRSNQSPPDSTTKTYKHDADFLKSHTKQVLELSDPTGQAKVLLSADYQGRVMTSTANGDGGTSFGWINYELLSSGKKRKQFNPVGGEERFWLGPEGGQYSLYFAAGDSFDISHWQVPALIDTLDFGIVQDDEFVTFFKKESVTNYSGTVFNLLIERKISLLTKNSLEQRLRTPIPEQVRFVAYQTENSIENAGPNDWRKESGLISIWLLGMFTPSDKTTVIIPFVSGPISKDLISQNYFGDIPPERLTIHDSVLYFTCDGAYRSKIGLPPSIAKPMAASFDFERNILTVTQFPIHRDSAYVNSKWEIQNEPFKGDAVNSYNDGPLADGTQLGPFYELESSSPALALSVGEKNTYTQTTAHFEGDFETLAEFVKRLLGVDLTELKK